MTDMTHEPGKPFIRYAPYNKPYPWHVVIPYRGCELVRSYPTQREAQLALDRRIHGTE